RGAALLDPLLRRQAAVKKGEFVLLLYQATARARGRGLIGGKPTAAVDATGLESRHTSRYFFRRAGRRHSSRLWTKLTVVCDAGSHFLAAATATLGPANDPPQFRPAVARGGGGVGGAGVRGASASDREETPRYCGEGRGVRAPLTPLNRRNRGRRWPKTRYRRQMVRRFRKKPRGSRHRRGDGGGRAAGKALSPHKPRRGPGPGARRAPPRAPPRPPRPPPP